MSMQLYYISSFLSFYDFCLNRQLSPLVAYFIRLIPLVIAVPVTMCLLIILR